MRRAPAQKVFTGPESMITRSRNRYRMLSHHAPTPESMTREQNRGGLTVCSITIGTSVRVGAEVKPSCNSFQGIQFGVESKTKRTICTMPMNNPFERRSTESPMDFQYASEERNTPPIWSLSGDPATPPRKRELLQFVPLIHFSETYHAGTHYDMNSS